MLQYIMKPTAEILQDDDFAVVIDGECIIDQIGLFPEDWQESPQYWCEQYEEDIHAEFKDGVLKLNFPKETAPEPEQPKLITIQ